MSTISEDVLAVEILLESRKVKLTPTAMDQKIAIQFQLPVDEEGDLEDPDMDSGLATFYGMKDDVLALELAYSLIPESRWLPNYRNVPKLLILVDLEVEQVNNSDWWKATATYRYDVNTGQGGSAGEADDTTLPYVRIGFSAGNKTKRLLKSKQVLLKESVDERPVPLLTGNEIGATEEEIIGVDVPASGLGITITAYYYPSKLTMALIRDFAEIFPGVNAQEFLGFEAGEVLILAADGEATIADVVPITYTTDIKRNIVDKEDPPFTNLTCKGHNHIDYVYVQTLDDQAKILKETVQYRIVHEIFDEVDMSRLGFPVASPDPTTTTTTTAP